MSKRKNREKRKFQGKELEKRIKKNQERTKFKVWIINKDEEVTIWRPDDGQHTIDIVPYFAGKKDPEIEEGRESYTYSYWAHFQVGASNKAFICPQKMFGKKCPICEYRDKLYMKGDNRYKEYFPKSRNLYNIVVQDSKKDAKKGVQVWDVSYHYFEKFLMAISKRPPKKGKEERIVNFAHPEKGKSVVFEIEPAKGENDYPKYIGHSFDDRDYEIDDEFLEQAYTLDEIVVHEPYDIIKNEFYSDENDKENGDDDNEEDDEKDSDTEKTVMEIESLFDELDDAEDNEELQEFVDENDIDYEVDEDITFKKNKKKIKALLEKMQKKAKEEEEKDNEDEVTRDNLEDMSWKKLKKWVKNNEELEDEIDLDDYDKDDKDKLIDDICEELDIDDD